MEGNISLLLASCLLLLTTFDLLRFSSKFETFAPAEYLYPDTKITSYLQQHAGISRVMTTDFRILPPNFPIMYHLQSVDGYDPLYLRRYGELIAASERGKPDISPPFGYNRIITPHKYDSPIINLLGVKYVLSLSDIKNQSLKKVFQDGQTQIYKNTHALPRVFFVYEVVDTIGKQDTINKLFDPSIDLTKQAIVQPEPGSLVPSSYGTGTATVNKYSENEVVIETSTDRDSFLVSTDIYYPTWNAAIDGKKTMIYLTDYAFRGIMVPKGKHVIKFTDHLL